jgi:hypothetical protein
VPGGYWNKHEAGGRTIFKASEEERSSFLKKRSKKLLFLVGGFLIRLSRAPLRGG